MVLVKPLQYPKSCDMWQHRTGEEMWSNNGGCGKITIWYFFSGKVQGRCISIIESVLVPSLRNFRSQDWPRTRTWACQFGPTPPQSYTGLNFTKNITVKNYLHHPAMVWLSYQRMTILSFSVKFCTNTNFFFEITCRSWSSSGRKDIWDECVCTSAGDSCVSSQVDQEQ